MEDELYNAFERMQRIETPWEKAQKNTREMMGPLYWGMGLAVDGISGLARSGYDYLRDYMGTAEATPQTSPQNPTEPYPNRQWW